MARPIVPVAALAAVLIATLVWFSTVHMDGVEQVPLPPRAEVPPLPPRVESLVTHRNISETSASESVNEVVTLEPDLVLLATTVSSSFPERSRAHVYDRTGETRYVLGMDQEIEAYDQLRLLEINDGQVVFDYRGQRLELFLDDDTSWPEDPGRRPAPVKVTELLAQMKSRQEGESEEEFASRYEHGLGKLYRMDLGLRTNKALFNQGVFAPKMKDGNQVGFYASRINKGSFWDTMGLEAGDVILEINGIPIEGPESNRDAVKDVVRSDTHLQLLVERDGETFETSTRTLPVTTGVWSDGPGVEFDGD